MWTVTIPNSFFGAFNPYSDIIHGDWFSPLGRIHHTGAVYLNGEWLAEAKTLDDALETRGELPLWFGQVESKTTTLWAQFGGADPNRELTEINVRQTVFYPEKDGMDFITVRGFILRCAATPWAPPTAEQIGLIGTHWSKGWIIEDNVVSHSMCSGISLGKYGDQWDNTSENSAQGYVKTIERAQNLGWSKENIGHHLVRNNIISHCEQAGIVGSLGPAFSTVTGNIIHDIYVRRLFSGAEIAGIKFHAAIDMELSNNHIFRSYRGLWLDWMAQGTRVTGNLFHDNVQDAFFEVDHGPFLVDNNIFLSKVSLALNSQGGAFVHNLICGGAGMTEYDGRMTPYLKPHSTEVAGLHDNPSGDLRFINNLLAQNGDLSVFSHARLPADFEGNVFLMGTKPSGLETSPRAFSGVRSANPTHGAGSTASGSRFRSITHGLLANTANSLPAIFWATPSFRIFPISVPMEILSGSTRITPSRRGIHQIRFLVRSSFLKAAERRFGSFDRPLPDSHRPHVGNRRDFRMSPAPSAPGLAA